MDLENGNSLNDKLLEQTLDGKLKIGQRVDDRTLEEDLVEDIPSLGIVDNTSSSDGVDEYESAVCHQTILFKMMPEFDLIPFELKIAIQKGIAAFLEEEECPVEVVESVDIQDEGTLEFYAIPESLEGEFKSWLYVQLRNCFPDASLHAL
ncbi:hypothetical protein BDR26DRAFT_867036 [Obelidium mucronatum]|nr:hypothetical protein BDR26DRAFT_867036 [Obelidium mucronatum]